MRVTESHLFPVRIREYYKPEDDIHEHLIKYFKDYPAHPSNFPEGVITSRPDLHKCDNEHVVRLNYFFEEALAEYRTQYQLYCDKLEISMEWFNLAPAGSGVGHPLHRHPMSYLSAVYYLTEGADTVFEDPMTPRTSDTLDVFQETLMQAEYGINAAIKAEPGKLILFPAWLKHYSMRQLDQFDRWTISFNAFPTGKVNVGPWDAAQLHVKLL